MDRVKNMMKKLLEQKDKANVRISELEGQLEEIKAKLEEVETEKKTLLDNCKTKDDELEDINKENEQIMKDNAELEFTIENNNRSIDSNKNELYNLEQEKIMKEGKCDEIKKQLDELIAECNADFGDL